VEFTRESLKNPCVSQCAQGAEGGEIFCSSDFLEVGLAKWGRLKRMRTLEWLSEENKQKKAREATVCGQLCMDDISNGLNESDDSSISDSSEESLSTSLLLLSSSEIFTEPFFSLTTNILPALYDSYSFIRVTNFRFFTH